MGRLSGQFGGLGAGDYLWHLIGIVAGLILTYGKFWMRAPFRLYVDLIRGTPVFVLVLACLHAAGPWLANQCVSGRCGWADLILWLPCIGNRAWCAASHSRGQLEAGKAIGLTFYQSLGYVLLPQALRQILPTWVNSSTEIVKASTLLSVIGVAELLLSTQQVIARTFMTLEFYLFAGFLFFVINYAIELFGRYIEKRVALP